MRHISCKEKGWIETLKESIADLGYIILEDVVPVAETETIRAHMYSAQEKIIQEIGREKLRAAGECGVLRIMPKFEPFFLSLLETPAFLAIIDATVSSTAILHLQNGFILPSIRSDQKPISFQHSFHTDFRRCLNGYLSSINILLAVDDFAEDNGCTLIVPGSHQRMMPPSQEYLKRYAAAAECKAGSAVVFDSTLYHAAGQNHSGKDRLAINHIFTRSFFKQQIDYVRALGDDFIKALPERTQQLLGYYTRVPTSLNEYYRPEHERIYRKHQG